jgi:hypothetical protein
VTNAKTMFFTMLIAIHAPYFTVHAAQHRVHLCQSLYDGCMQIVHDQYKDSPSGIARCKQLLAAALATGDDVTGVWPSTVRASILCEKKPLLPDDDSSWKGMSLVFWTQRP